MEDRRSGRVAAFQLIYQMDASDQFHQVEEVMALFFVFLAREMLGEARRFAESLCRGVAEHLEQVDTVINRASDNWRLERMSRVDRSILRLAVYELTWASEKTPVRVVINEAIEIGKHFGSSESSSFINGVLNRVSQDLRPVDLL